MKRILLTLVPKLLGYYFNIIALIAPKKAGKLALLTFAKVRKGQLDNHRILPLLEEAKDERFSIGTHEIQSYHWPGEKEAVLLLHGWESNTHRWRNLIAQLKKEKFGIYALDAPAHGYSTGSYHFLPDFVEAAYHLVQKHNIKTLIGHSMGGMAICYLLFKHKENPVERFITLGAPVDFSLIVSGYNRRVPFNKTVYNALDQEMYRLVNMNIEAFSSRRFAQEIHQKALLMHDRFDPTIPSSQSEQLHKALANSELVVTENFGHSMHQDEVCDKIMLFLNSN